MKKITSIKSGKKLSIPRLLITLFVLAGIIYAVKNGWQDYKYMVVNGKISPWFAPYVDVTATPTFSFEQLGSKPDSKNIVLSFVVPSAKDGCTPSWGSVYSFDETSKVLDLDRRIARYRQQGGNIAISFGGLLNSELSVKCTDEKKLQQAYLDVINRYQIDTVDFDLEGEVLSDNVSLKRRAQTLAIIQNKLRSENKKLAVWLTLPASTQGLTTEGTNAVSVMLKEGVDLAGVNAMTMDFGNSKNKNQSMQDAVEKALNETHRQLGILFSNAGIYLNDNSVWSKMGATVMIGQNDIAGEVFSIDDAKAVNKFAIAKGIGRLSIWSANRDIQCGENYVNVTVVSDSCSGVKQEKGQFSSILSENFEGDITTNASLVTVEDPKIELTPDNPDESPYQIWSENGVYLEGTKVVWHHNVYQAKWWTKGDLPDNPVLQSYQTPWQLVGPVLPGEKPIPQPTLPPGTYPTWSGTEIYNEGDRILFNGIPYQAKWWTQGDSPAAATSNPDSSPWVVLSQQEIEKILGKNEGN